MCLRVGLAGVMTWFGIGQALIQLRAQMPKGCHTTLCLIGEVDGYCGRTDLLMGVVESDGVGWVPVCWKSMLGCYLLSTPIKISFQEGSFALCPLVRDAFRLDRRPHTSDHRPPGLAFFLFTCVFEILIRACGGWLGSR